MHRPLHTTRVGDKPNWNCGSKKLKFTLLLAALMLWVLYLQLKHWDGLMEPEHYSDNVPDTELDEYTQRWLEYGYNAWLAERLPLRRDLPDVRDKRCHNISYKKITYGANQVSLVVIFRNEQLAMLLRTLHSVIQRTDFQLIGEILVINDHSDMGNWQEQLYRNSFDAYVRRYVHPTARIYHMEEHTGLQKLRTFAAREANFDILVFLDAHVEVNVGWLEPLLAVLISNPYTLVLPQLDLLNEQTLRYERVVEQRGLFDWSLRRREVPLLWPQLKNLPHPYATPVPHLSVFAVDADWFNTMAHFDLDIESPAATELALSFMIWRRGNSILQVPCSRVGHLQPTDLSYMQRYGNVHQMGQQQYKSYRRLVEIWLSDTLYKSVVYQHQPQIQAAHVGSLVEVQNLFQFIHFSSFEWYLQHVANDLLQHFPLQPRIDLAYGALRSVQQSNHCLTGDLATGRITLELCAFSLLAAQNWTLTYMNDLRLGDRHCVEVLPNRMVALNLCHAQGGRQSWHFHVDDNRLISNIHCLEVNAQLMLTMRSYNAIRSNQMWYFEHINLEALRANSLER